MGQLGIGEVAARCGIASSAIRYYESEGLLPKAGRHGGRRYYDEAILDRLGMIDLAKQAGFTIAEIKQLMRGFGGRTPPSQRWQALTQRKLAELEERIAEAERMKQVLARLARCHCPSVEDCGRALRATRP